MSLADPQARAVAHVADAIDEAVNAGRWRVVIVDGNGDAAGWIDPEGRFTNCLWLAATYPTEDDALAAMRMSKGYLRMPGCRWYATRTPQAAA